MLISMTAEFPFQKFPWDINVITKLQCNPYHNLQLQVDENLGATMTCQATKA